ncbi:MAG: DinG family ATP-dependent helicase YoaA, partial [uncultured Gemmatimonadaceae bacterium]
GLDEHDQPAGAADREGPAVPRRRAHRPAGALRDAQGVAQLP